MLVCGSPRIRDLQNDPDAMYKVSSTDELVPDVVADKGAIRVFKLFGFYYCPRDGVMYLKEAGENWRFFSVFSLLKCFREAGCLITLKQLNGLIEKLKFRVITPTEFFKRLAKTNVAISLKNVVSESSVNDSHEYIYDFMYKWLLGLREMYDEVSGLFEHEYDRISARDLRTVPSRIGDETLYALNICFSPKRYDDAMVYKLGPLIVEMSLFRSGRERLERYQRYNRDFTEMQSSLKLRNIVEVATHMRTMSVSLSNYYAKTYINNVIDTTADYLGLA